MMKKKLMNALVLLVSFTILQSCSTTGNPTLKDENRESIGRKLEEGFTTKNQVITILGDPMETAFIADGQEVWTYELSKMKPFLRNFIPYVAILSSGADGVQQQLTILFDDNDVVEEYRWSESEIQQRSGILTSVN
jgi:outer membrane protein assembly factor BamE (lipoprotein component of BamABCDE complex)